MPQLLQTLYRKLQTLLYKFATSCGKFKRLTGKFKRLGGKFKTLHGKFQRCCGKFQTFRQRCELTSYSCQLTHYSFIHFANVANLCLIVGDYLLQLAQRYTYVMKSRFKVNNLNDPVTRKCTYVTIQRSGVARQCAQLTQ